MSLLVPTAGLELETSNDKMFDLPLQAFAITLSDGMLEDMIESFQNGQEIELSLGQSPAFLYGGSSHSITRTPENFSYDLYVTDPTEVGKASLTANPATGLIRKQHLNYLPACYLKNALSSEDNGRENGGLEIIEDTDRADRSSQSKGSLLQPQSSLSKKTKSTVTGKKTVAGNAMSISSQGRSRPTSPALSTVGSPLPESSIESSHQQIVKEAKELRAPLTHALAVRDMSYDELWEKWGKDGNDEDSRREFRQILDKVADLNKSLGKYSMKKMYWKELDIWNHGYDSDADRQAAIDNAVRHFDKMRIGASEPEWQKLLPFDERGKGKCLSKLQASLAKGPKAFTPKINVQNADDTSGAGSPDTDNRSVSGSQPMSRSSSQTKPKKAAEPKKNVISAPKKTTALKASPSKTTAKTTAKAASNGRGPLSQEFVKDSDESSDEIPLSQSKNVAKKQPAPVVRAPAKPLPATSAAGPASLPKKPPPPVVSREPTKAPAAAKAPVKRPRDEDDSSSSSGTPLAKKIKAKEAIRAPKEPIRAPKEVVRAPKEAIRAPKEAVRAPREIKPVKESRPAPLNTVKARPSDMGQNASRTTGSNTSFNRAKNTSPAKSSPLASSPPTNASDIDPAEEAMIASANKNAKKRKEEAYYNDLSSASSAGGAAAQQLGKNSVRKRAHDDDVSSSRRNAASKLPPEVVAKARRFKEAYSDYERLHYELSGSNNPEESKLNELMSMHRRLEKMKKEIYLSTSGPAYDGERATKTGEQKRGGAVASSRRERDEYNDYGRH